jgi:beta-aspartyl-peptidase (threonine type)
VIRRALLLAALAVAGCATASAPSPRSTGPAPAWAIVVHGGAGVIERSAMTPETDAAYRAAMARATAAGTAVLQNGGSALDAIEAAIVLMEDDPLFNAGRGAVFTAEGRNELDASVMDGSTLKAGAVAGLTRIRHPIRAARAVMERSPHVMLIGPGAETFAAGQNLEQVDPGFFFTERRWQGLERTLRERGDPMPARPRGAPPAPAAALDPALDAAVGVGRDENRFGTVGVVALDRSGRIAAGTSTGGTTGKRFGRVGDAPIIGAGTYADNKSCAVSPRARASSSSA